MDGFVCIITGANSMTGIGRATAYAFAKKNPKAIYVTDLAENNLADLAKDITEKTGVDCIPKRVDASSDEDIKSVIADAMEKYGRLDVFFANAGIATFHSMVEETKEAFLHIMQVNSWSVFAAIKYASEAMQKTSAEKTVGSGSIIATASVAGVRSGAGPMSYSASKAAVINICQSAAWRLRGKNIRVNAICPGLIKTEMTERVLEHVSGNELMQNMAIRSSALERYGEPSEIASMVTFLASNEASFITGQDIKVDAGMTASLPYIPLFADR
ncbi:unnamed protein product [Mucor hiemalis]